MTVSSLSKGSILSPNHYNGRDYRISRITIHMMAAVWSAESCGYWFRDGTRNASSNYGIGNNGDIMCYVEEQNAAWTSSNYDNDNRAITIEVSNSQMGGDWPISDAAYKSLIALCADICNRYGIIPAYNGTPNASLTEHKMFSATSCPGPWIHERLASLQIQNDIIKAMKGEDVPERTVWQWQANMSDAQLWKPIHNSDGTLSLKNKACGLMLDVRGGEKKSGAVIQAFPANGTDAQKFKFKQLGKPYNPKFAAPVEIAPVLNDKLRLDVSNASKEDGTKVQTWTANGTNAQRWQILDQGNAYWAIVNVATGKVLDVKNGGK